MRRITYLAALTLLMATSTGAWAADDVDTVLKKLETAWNKHKSYSAKMVNVTQTDTESRTEGTFEVVREGDKILCHIETKTVATYKQNDQDVKMESTGLVVCDGNCTYILGEMGGQKFATKTKADATQTGAPKSALDPYRKDHDLKVLPDEKVDGRSVAVIEATPKAKGDSPMGKIVMYFDLEAGLLTKTVTFTGNDKPLNTMTFTDLKLDPKIDPDHFKFKAPEGVTVVDQTGGDQKSEAKTDDKPAPRKEEPRKEEPKKDEPKKP